MGKSVKIKQQIEYDDMQSHVADKAREIFKRPAYPGSEVVHKTASGYLGGRINLTKTFPQCKEMDTLDSTITNIMYYNSPPVDADEARKLIEQLAAQLPGTIQMTADMVLNRMKTTRQNAQEIVAEIEEALAGAGDFIPRAETERRVQCEQE